MFNNQGGEPASFAQRVNTYAATASAVIGAVSAVFAILAQQEAAQSNARQLENEIKLKEMRVTLERNADSRADRESFAKLDQFVYQEMVKLFELPATTPQDVRRKKEAAVSGLVQTMTSETVRAPFNQALSLQLTDPALREKATERAAYYQQENEKAAEAPAPQAVQQAAAGKSQLAGLKVDLFYCEGEPNAAALKTRAESITAAMNKEGSLGRWRVRNLSPSVNELPGMQVHSPQVRYNASENEQAAAQELAALLKKQLQQGGAQAPDFKTRQVNMRSPGYVSGFLCGVPVNAST
jgi:hypothetical protein